MRTAQTTIDIVYVLTLHETDVKATFIMSLTLVSFFATLQYNKYDIITHTKEIF